MRKLSSLLLGVSLFLPVASFADTAINSPKTLKKHKTHTTHKVHYKGEAKPAPAAAQNNKPSDFKVTGYLDGSYNHLIRNKFTSGSFDRVFDLVPNGFTLQQAATTLAYQPSQGFGALLNLIAGHDASLIAPYGLNPSSQFDSQTFAVDLTQAYLQYVKGPVTLMGGIFLTLVGVEQIDPTQNANFSRSILFYNTPDTHTGVRGIYAVNDKLTLTLGVNDGWDNIRDWSRRKTIEFGMSYTVNPMFSFSLQGYNGQERATPRTAFGPEGTRSLIDFIATLNATDKLTLIVNTDYGCQSTATLPTGGLGSAVWYGIAGYANYKFNEKWRTSLRGEYFNDPNGFRTGVMQNWRELTLTIGYIPLKNLEVRAEARHDFSNTNSFLNSNNITASNNTQSYALEAVYKFS